jgi:hypothetical protein
MTTMEIPEEASFCQPIPIPKDICKFLSIDENIQLPRPEVAKRIFQYVKDKNLRSSEDRRIIIPDIAIKELFNLKDDEILDWKNFQVKLAEIYRNNKGFTINI